MNHCTFTGRITKDLEIKGSEGKEALNFDIAVQRKYKNQNDEYESDFINCVAFRKTAEFLFKYASKGYLIGVSGELRNNNFKRDDGTVNYGVQLIVNEVDTSILFLNKKQEKQSNDSYYNTSNQQAGTNTKQSSNYNNASDDPFVNAPVINDDDLPF